MLYDPSVPAILGYRGEFFFLSNFYSDMYPLIETFEGTRIEYPTAEHAYQASKSLDLGARLNIARQPTPARAKFAGRSVKLRADWAKIDIAVMRRWVREKFSQDDLRQRLMVTWPAQLVEANNHGDQYWGTDVFGDGENHLGLLQMEFRQDLVEYYGQVR